MKKWLYRFWLWLSSLTLPLQGNLASVKGLLGFFRQWKGFTYPQAWLSLLIAPIWYKLISKMSRVRTKELLAKKKRKEQGISPILENCYQLYLPSSLFLCSRDVRMQSAGLSRHESSRTSGLNTSRVDLVVFFCLFGGGSFDLFFFTVVTIVSYHA